MNIALFVDSYLPTKNGVVTVVNQLYEGLKAQGHHVVIVTVENPNATDDDPNIFRVPSTKLGMGTKDQFMGYPFLRSVSKFLKKNKIELIHVHTEFPIGINSIHEAKKCHLPLICTTHTMWEDYYKYYLRFGNLVSVNSVRKVIRLFYKNMYALVNVSQKAHDYFKQDFMCPDIPSAVIPNSLNPKNYCSTPSTPEQIMELRHKLGVKDDEKIVLYVGRIVEEKRVYDLEESLEKVLAKDEKIKAVIVGDGSALKTMKKLSAASAVSDRFIYTGFVDWYDVHRYYEAGDIYVTSSLSEMHSMTVLEALTSGLALVVRKDTSFNDTVIEGFNGFQSETDDKLAEDILELTHDDELRHKYGANSKSLSVNFLPDVFIKRYAAFYETVLKCWKTKTPLTDEMLENAVKEATEAHLKENKAE